MNAEARSVDPVRLAFVKFAFVALTCVRFALVTLARVRLAPERLAPVRSAWERLAPVRLQPTRSAPGPGLAHAEAAPRGTGDPRTNKRLTIAPARPPARRRPPT